VTKNISFLTSFKEFAKKYNFSKNQKIEIAYGPENPKNSIIDTKFNPLTVIIPPRLESVENKKLPQS
jgi:hypothetical protein